MKSMNTMGLNQYMKNIKFGLKLKVGDKVLIDKYLRKSNTHRRFPYQVGDVFEIIEFSEVSRYFKLRAFSKGAKITEVQHILDGKKIYKGNWHKSWLTKVEKENANGTE